MSFPVCESVSRLIRKTEGAGSNTVAASLAIQGRVRSSVDFRSLECSDGTLRRPGYVISYDLRLQIGKAQVLMKGAT